MNYRTRQRLQHLVEQGGYLPTPPAPCRCPLGWAVLAAASTGALITLALSQLL